MPSIKRKLPSSTKPSTSSASPLKRIKQPDAVKQVSEPEDEESLEDANFDDESEEDELDISDTDGQENAGESSDDDNDDDDDNNDADNDTARAPIKRAPLPLDPHKLEASREAHLKQKAQLQERKAKKPHADILARSKSLWAQLNQKKVAKAKRRELVDELFGLVSDNVVEVVFKHDASRIIQACFKFGTEAQRTSILRELKGRLVELSKSIYGKFFVVKMLYYGSPAHRDTILSEIHGNVRKLIKHKEAAYVVEDAFREYTTPAQQEALVSEMYGAEFSVFESAAGGKTLAELLTQSPEKRDTIMKNLWDSISSSVKKGSIGFTIIHRALLSFLSNANQPEQVECIELVRELLPEIVHTKDGSQVACMIIALGTAKDRKAIMKSFREHFTKAMTDEYGWLAVVALFMCVDDTVLLTKAFVPDIEKQCVSLFEDKFARKVFLYVLGDTQARYFTTRELELFATVTNLKAATSKKGDGQRRTEILQALGSALVATLMQNLEGMVRDPNASALVAEILLHAPSGPEKQELVDRVADQFSRSSGAGAALSLEEHAPRLLKILVQGGWYDKSLGRVEKAQPGVPGFARRLAHGIKDNLEAWATGPGSFVVVSLLESASDTGNDDEQVEAELNVEREGKVEFSAADVNALRQELKAIKDAIERAAEAGNKGSKILLLKL